jgi:predicted GNAT family N-acyltransferase
MKIDIHIIEFATPEYDQTIYLRNKILRIPLGLEFSEDQLSGEYNDIHIGAYNGKGDLLACLVLTPLKDNCIKMRQVAVDSHLQGKGIGTLLCHFVEQYCVKQGYTSIILNARDTAVPFYTKMNYTIEGEAFVEVGIPHNRMVKNLV